METRAHRYDLVAVDPDTGESRTLLGRHEVIDGPITYAAWSPDGRWVVFHTAIGTTPGLWVMDADMEIRLLKNGIGAPGNWAWSPTDARLATIGTGGLTVVDVSTGRRTELGEMAGEVTLPPVWSPDGTRLVYGARGGSVYSVDVRSAERSLLVRLPGENLDSMDEIEWSPDGSRIAIMNDLEPGGARLYVMKADGSGVRVLLDNYVQGRMKEFRRVVRLAWSPDGESIAYVTHRSGADRLRTISTFEESAPFTVATSRTIEDPAWSPDGSRIAFVASTADGLRWYAARADGVHMRGDIDELTYLSWGGGPVQHFG